MEKKYHKWTKEEEKVILDLYKQGKTRAEIAVLLKVSCQAVNSKIYKLKKQGKIKGRKTFKWTVEKEKELVKVLHDNAGNLNQGFKIFAENNNCSIRAVIARYYNRTRKVRVKDKYPIFGIFSRYRAASNSKIYQKEQSKGYTFWKVIKKVFGYK